jgi:hypothetical protein
MKIDQVMHVNAVDSQLPHDVVERIGLAWQPEVEGKALSGTIPGQLGPPRSGSQYQDVGSMGETFCELSDVPFGSAASAVSDEQEIRTR